jgi:multidrug transporter EmrE-like cation transporter
MRVDSAAALEVALISTPSVRAFSESFGYAPFTTRSGWPAILAGGAAIMAIAGILFFKEPASFSRLAGIILALAGLFLLRL